MAKHYLEMRQELTDEEDLAGVQPVFVRVEVTGKADAIARKAKYTAEFTGKAHKVTHHVCNHASNAPCISEEI